MTVDEIVKSRRGVLPANVGIQNLLKILDPGVRRDDGKSEFRTFCGAVKVGTRTLKCPATPVQVTSDG
jgi:hypothetical protein